MPPFCSRARTQKVRASHALPAAIGYEEQVVVSDFSFTAVARQTVAIKEVRRFIAQRSAGSLEVCLAPSAFERASCAVTPAHDFEPLAQNVVPDFSLTHRHNRSRSSAVSERRVPGMR
jgi:hypothetical protein